MKQFSIFRRWHRASLHGACSVILLGAGVAGFLTTTPLLHAQTSAGKGTGAGGASLQTENYEADLEGTFPNYEDLQIQTAQPGRKQPAQKQREENLRRLMHSLGCDVPEVQNAIIEFIEQDTSSRQPLRESSSRLFVAMRTAGISDAQLSVLLEECRAEIEAEKTRRAAAQQALKDKIGYNMTPRLEALLMMLGLQGNVVITTPNPKIVTQLEQERKKLRRDLDGFKIEVDSLRRERDAARAERDALVNGDAHTVKGSADNAAKTQRERDQLKRENDRIRKENQALRRELEAAKKEAALPPD